MRKSVISFVAACAAATALLCGCNVSCGSTPAVEDKYEKLNKMLEASYSEITLTVKDTFDEETELVSVYKMSYTANAINVEYSVQRFSTLSLDAPAENVITTLEGEAVIMNGAVVSVNGQDANITADIADVGLEFDDAYFDAVQYTAASFGADVRSPSDFLGASVTCTGMKVRASFSDGKMNSLIVSYTSSAQSKVEYKYEFKV